MTDKRLIIIGIIFMLTGVAIGFVSAFGGCSPNITTLPPLVFDSDGGTDGG